MYSISLFLVISRITSGSATLIDNIFVNTVDTDTISGLLINDITDHLPVFVVLPNFFIKQKIISSTYAHKPIWNRTTEHIAALKADLAAQNWSEVFVAGDSDAA